MSAPEATLRTSNVIRVRIPPEAVGKLCASVARTTAIASAASMSASSGTGITTAP